MASIIYPNEYTILGGMFRRERNTISTADYPLKDLRGATELIELSDEKYKDVTDIEKPKRKENEEKVNGIYEHKDEKDGKKIMLISI